MTIGFADMLADEQVRGRDTPALAVERRIIVSRVHVSSQMAKRMSQVVNQGTK